MKTYGITHELSAKVFDEMFPIFKDIYIKDLLTEIKFKTNGIVKSEPKIDVFDDFVIIEETGETWPIKLIICTAQYEEMGR
jgi:hypothetical protein